MSTEIIPDNPNKNISINLLLMFGITCASILLYIIYLYFGIYALGLGVGCVMFSVLTGLVAGLEEQKLQNKHLSPLNLDVPMPLVTPAKKESNTSLEAVEELASAIIGACDESNKENLDWNLRTAVKKAREKWRRNTL